MVAALTGRRLANVRELRWDSIDLEERLFLDEGTTMKNNQPNHSAFCETVHKVLSRLRQEAAKDAIWVFPGRREGCPVVNPHHAWKKIREAAGMPKLRIHDLRHSAASWATGEHMSERAVGKYLSHRSATSTSRYQHANTEGSRAVANAVEEVFRRYTEPREGD